jgi:hypothetical protein
VIVPVATAVPEEPAVPLIVSLPFPVDADRGGSDVVGNSYL